MQYSFFTNESNGAEIVIGFFTSDNNGVVTINPAVESDMLTAYENLRSVIGSYILTDIMNTNAALEFHISDPNSVTENKTEHDYTMLSAENKVFVDVFVELVLATLV